MFTLRNRLSSLAACLPRLLAVGLAAAELLAPRPAGAMVRRPTFSDSIPEAAHLSTAQTPAGPEPAEGALPPTAEYLAFLVETPEGPCWVICRNDPVNNVDPLGLSVLSWIMGAGYSGYEADEFDVALGMELIAIGGGMKQGVKDVFNGRAYACAVDNTSTIMQRSMSADGGVLDSAKALTAGVAYQVTLAVGINNLYEAGFGIDVLEERELSGVERTSRGLMGGSQAILTGVGLKAMYDPNATFAGSVQAVKETVKRVISRPAQASDDFITVYRGDQAGTSVIKSRAAAQGGYRSSQQLIEQSNLDDLLRAHALDSGTPASPFISTTTDPSVARFFAGPDGVVNKFRIPRSRIVQNTHNNMLVPAGENGALVSEAEWLVPSYIRLSEFVK